MAELKIENSNNENSRKRGRDELGDDSEANSPVSKLARIESFASDDSGVSSPEAKRIQDDLFNFLDDGDSVPPIHDLDSVIRSFEEEILLPEQASAVVTSESGETRPELGFLLEASDDELGLPPSFSTGEEQKIPAIDLKASESDAVNLDGMALGFENDMPAYEPFNFGIGSGGSDGGRVNVSNDFITLDGGLFESYEPGDISELAWRPESLSAS